jgi:hypothetical protein
MREDANRNRGRDRASNVVPMLVVLFAVLSAVVLYAWDPEGSSPAPQPNYRADTPPAPPPAPNQ